MSFAGPRRARSRRTRKSGGRSASSHRIFLSASLCLKRASSTASASPRHRIVQIFPSDLRCAGSRPIFLGRQRRDGRERTNRSGAGPGLRPSERFHGNTTAESLDQPLTHRQGEAGRQACIFAGLGAARAYIEELGEVVQNGWVTALNGMEPETPRIFVARTLRSSTSTMRGPWRKYKAALSSPNMQRSSTRLFRTPQSMRVREPFSLFRRPSSGAMSSRRLTFPWR